MVGDAAERVASTLVPRLPERPAPRPLRVLPGRVDLSSSVIDTSTEFTTAPEMLRAQSDLSCFWFLIAPRFSRESEGKAPPTGDGDAVLFP